MSHMSQRVSLREVVQPDELTSPAASPPPPISGHSYDAVPYRSYPYPQTRPERLATISTLLGLSPAPVERCRVLELGCCSGGNLIPMAEQLPGAQFLGVDASARQVALGEAALAKMELKNLSLTHGDILDIDQTWGAFDYIICHGVYSWVPKAVQEKILAVCSENLTPNGIAYVSYNTLPGWRMRGVIRDIMRFRARGFERPADQLFHARALVDFLAQSASAENNPYGLLLKQELEMLRDKDESYLLHEHLEEVNEPVYFHEFIARSERCGLQYLGEADFSSMSLKNLPQKMEPMLQSVASDIIELEQYIDFVRNRMFRQTLLCHRGLSVNREVSPERLLGLHVASSARAEGKVDMHPDAKAVFRGGGAVTTTTEPLMKAALLHLGEIWPQTIPFTELLARSRAFLNRNERAIVDAERLNRDSHRLAEPLIRCYTTNQVELSVRGSRFRPDIPDRPMAPAYARIQAESAATVTNLRHEWVRLGDLERHVVRHLDGTRDRQALQEVLVGLAMRGDLIIHDKGERLVDDAKMRRVLAEPLETALNDLARRALLVAV